MWQKIKFFFLSIVSLAIGMKVTLMSAFRPPVTLHYPYKKQPMKKNFRGMVDLRPPDCVICYQCIKICPTAALELAHKQETNAEGKKVKEITKFDYNAELCCFCGLCDEICPTDAIYMNQLYEVAALSHDEILKIDLLKEDKYKSFEEQQHNKPKVSS